MTRPIKQETKTEFDSKKLLWPAYKFSKRIKEERFEIIVLFEQQLE
jgi:hypothetical protein